MQSAAYYDRLMARARGRKLSVYFETHHVIPRALGGNNNPENLVDLTYREHFLAHWLLTKIYVGSDRRKMVMALHCMTLPLKARGTVVTGWRVELSKRLLRDEWMRRVAKRRQDQRDKERLAGEAWHAIAEKNKAISSEWIERNGARLAPVHQVHQVRRSSKAFAPVKGLTRKTGKKRWRRSRHGERLTEMRV